MAAKMKKRRCQHKTDDSEEKRIYNNVHCISAVMCLCSNNYLCNITLTPLKIMNCNALSSGGSLFSKAFCETWCFDDGLVLGDVFHDGMEILVDYVKNMTIPANKAKSLVLDKFLDFLNCDRNIKIPDSQSVATLTEAEYTILMANHLLGKLAISPYYLVNKKFSRKEGDQCFCGEDSCKISGHYGDTSLGNMSVWHGNLDVVINNDLPVESLGDKPTSPNEKDETEVQSKCALSRCSNITPQTIVFSFFQKKTHPEREYFLTPCIGIRHSEMLVMFYDSEHDVLLESSSIPLFKDSYSNEFSYVAILVSWLTVNYKFLCTGLPDFVKTYKSDFFAHASEKIKIYEENLFFGDVDRSQSEQYKLKFCPQVKCSPRMHECEKVLQELLWSFAH